MKIIFSISFLCLVLINSCSISDFEDEYIFYQWAGVQKIQVLSNERGKLTLKVDLTVPTPCNEFHTKETFEVVDTIYVKYYSKVKKGIPCILILGHITITDNFLLQSNKNYFFRFYQEENKYLDTLIKIN